jgi:translation initiation factor 2 gamma subunit (eIF-2gamma)
MVVVNKDVVVVPGVSSSRMLGGLAWGSRMIDVDALEIGDEVSITPDAQRERVEKVQTA